MTRAELLSRLRHLERASRPLEPGSARRRTLRVPAGAPRSWHWLGIATLRLVLMAPQLPTTLAEAQQPPALRSARDLQLIIETDRASYRVGDTIRVRVTFKNVSSTPIGWSPKHHENEIRLIVATTDGQVVAPTLSFGGASASGAGYVKLGPQQTWTRPWHPLSDWGYVLGQPGTYTVVGIPLVSGYGIEPDFETVRSNRATFTVSQ